MWADKNPEAAVRLSASKEALEEVFQETGIPVENLLTPDHLRRVCWSPPEDLSLESLNVALNAMGARAWQRARVVPLLLKAFVPQDQ
jgi:ribonuclease D